MATGFQFKGDDLDLLLEPRRSGVNSAKFGGQAGVFVSGTNDLLDRYAAHPGYSFGYRREVDGLKDVYKHGGDIPSAIGCRPSQWSGWREAPGAIRLTNGTWHVWREGNNIRVRNSSGTITNHPASSFGICVPPKFMICKVVGGGGGGGGGSNINAASGGAGGGGGVAWMEIPDATEATYAAKALVCFVGNYGSGASSASRAGDGETTYINRGSKRIITATGGQGGIRKGEVWTNGGTWTQVNDGTGTFISFYGSSGSPRTKSGYYGGSLDVGSFKIADDVTISRWHASGGYNNGRGGSGGSSMFAYGGDGGYSKDTPERGEEGGGGGGGGTFKSFSSQPGARGGRGIIAFDY